MNAIGYKPEGQADDYLTVRNAVTKHHDGFDPFYIMLIIVGVGQRGSLFFTKKNLRTQKAT